MIGLLTAAAAMLVACTPPPEEFAMHRPSPDNDAPSLAEAHSEGWSVPAPGQPLSAAKPLPPRRADTSAEAEGRRTLSTAFVRVGPDGHLIVERRDGRVLALRHVVMLPRKYCGEQVPGGPAAARYCGAYSEVAAARPGPALERPDPAATQAELPPGPAKRD